MDTKNNYTSIIISIVIAIILLSVIPIVTNIQNECPPCNDIEPIQNYVKFVSDSPRTITPAYTQDGITLQYSIDKGITWNNIASGVATPSANEIWFRGRATGEKSLYIESDNSNAWLFSGDSSNKLHIYGDLRYLLCDNLGDNSITFNIADYCFASMFFNAHALVTAPSLPAITLAYRCYYRMFYNCTSLNTIPSLPARSVVNGCYSYMFYGCTSLKFSTTKTGSFQFAWRIPTSGTGKVATTGGVLWNAEMIKNTSGLFTSNPSINTTYYVENPPV